MDKKNSRKRSPKKTAEKDGSNDFLVVGIGASAGGIKALKEFFSAMSSEPEMAFVVILHLSQQHESNLAEILQRETEMTVEQVTETVKVEPNKVYVIPPAKHLEMVDGVIRLKEPERIKGRRVPVDHFFRSLAEAYGRRAVSIILSGTGTDGTVGMKHIKGNNGFAMVQSPEDAEYDGMPRSAIETRIVDVVMRVAEMPEKLLSVRDSTEKLKLTDGEDGEVAKEIKNFEMLRDVLTLLRIRTGHDFSNYKHPTLIRRVARHLQIHETDDLREYIKILREKPDEILSLLKNLLINVTNFFRDKESFEVLEKNVIPKLFENKTAGDQVRVWIAGCSTGEEAYSMAILLAEYAANLPEPPKIQIFASDVDEDAISEAREGRFTEAVAADISPERISQFFLKEDGFYRIRKQIREMILFAPHNILRDPPFSRLDLVSCRNVMIYLNRETQEKVLQVFHFALKENGFLFLGSSESAESLPNSFAAFDKKHRIYQYRPLDSAWNEPPPLPVWQPPAHNFPAETRRNLQSFSELHYSLIEEYAPPSIFINSENEILHLSENAGRFLRFVGGAPSANLMKVIHPMLLSDVRTALYAARQENEPVEAKNIRVNLSGAEKFINLQVRPLKMPEAAALIMFKEVKLEPEAEVSPKMIAAGDQTMETVVRQMEDELHRTKDYLRATIEQYETSVEEHKAANEELQAINEEMRSASEELETSKEELQSVNEELTTVNTELKEKIEEVSQANSDLQNLVQSTDIATIFLDRSLMIKRYTTRVTEIFNIIPSDVGRPLAHVTHRLSPDDFETDAEEALTKLRVSEREVVSKDDRFYIARFSPYRTVEDKIDGVVVSFIDITDRKNAEKIIKSNYRYTKLLRDLGAHAESHSNMQSLLEKTLDVAITMMDADAGTIQIFDEKTGELVILASKNLTPEMEERFRHVNARSGTSLGTALATGDRIFSAYDDADAPDLHGDLKAHVEAGLLSSQSTPLIARNGKPIGMFTTHWKERREVNEREIHFLDLLARQAADLIEQGEAEKALRESEERLRLILESAEAYAIITTDLDGIITRWNKGAENVFGYTEAEAVGQPADIIFTPEDRKKGVPEKEMKNALKKGRADDERWHFRKDGTRIYVSGVMTLLKDGEIEGFVKIARDLTKEREMSEELYRYRNELEEQVKERTKELAQVNNDLRSENKRRRRIEKERIKLLEQLVTTQEDERRRIARDMHDHFGQQLTAMRLLLESLKKMCGDNEELCSQIDNTQTIAKQLDSDVSFFVWELRPTALDDLGLKEALTNFVNKWAEHFKIPAEIHIGAFEEKRLAGEAGINLYRIAQEALNNIFKHAEATKVSVIFEQRDSHIVLIIEDNGKGFDPQEKTNRRKGLGLIGMRERATLMGGDLEIEAAKGKGTTIFARIPMLKQND